MAPRSVRICGRADLLHTEDRFGPCWHLRVRPEIKWSWGIEEGAGGGPGFRPHRTVHEEPSRRS